MESFSLVFSFIFCIFDYMEEIWKEIPGYDGRYSASSEGRIRSNDWVIAWRGTTKLVKGRILKPARDQKGYLYVGLTNSDGIMKCIKVHRLVALTFIPNPDKLPEINHKNEDKTNNSIWVNPDGTVDPERCNLEWCTSGYNHNYGSRNERARNNVKRPVLQYSIDGEFIREWDSAKDAGIALGGAGNAAIINCCSGRIKTAYGYVWKRKR